MSNTQRQTIHDHSDHCTAVESLLGFSYWLNERVTPIYNDSKHAESHKIGYFAHVTFTNNMVLCYSSLLSLERSLYGPCAATMRPVWESFPKIFYLSYNQEDLFPVLLKDQIPYTQNLKDKKRAVENFLARHTVYGECDIDETIANIKKYTRQYFLKSLYSKPTISNVNRIYSRLSNAVHANLGNHTYNYDKSTTDVAFLQLELMLFHNIIIEVECNLPNKRTPGFPYKESLEFLNGVWADMSRDKTLLMLPDRPGLDNTAANHIFLQ